MNRAGLEELHRKISGEVNRMDISTQLGIVKKKEVNKHNLRLHISMIFKRWWVIDRNRKSSSTTQEENKTALLSIWWIWNGGKMMSVILKYRKFIYKRPKNKNVIFLVWYSGRSMKCRVRIYCSALPHSGDLILKLVFFSVSLG